MFHREGFFIISISFILTAIFFILSDLLIKSLFIKYLIQFLSVFFLVLILQFFRNPKRSVSPDDKLILSPVDGKVVIIDSVFEKEYFKDNRKQVSIFMSPINVHVTRFPISGRVVYSKYHPGKYLFAWLPKSSEENERTSIVINTPEYGEIMYRQIAGALARRIVNYAKKGDDVNQGDDAGFIKFGSRVDIFLPIDSPICVKIDENAIGAKTIISSL
ncbi:MAG: phosphatidylserine decarboxylase family protein [Flavobacteriales bacterium]|jgi:phosphatidylserine decarboxylase|nr:phosphatidylserine decarboxylase family protein [Flavobacteriales bacterium]|tara:strand:- start:161 stop:811 length:651 start_codon:yes stop_codon:yes gene_type:complete